MKKVLVFGTFDGIHPGHENFFAQAAALGNELHAVIALDSTVRKVKQKQPRFSQTERKNMVENHPLVKAAYLGDPDDKYRIIETINPDIIALGYDQRAFTDQLESELKARGIHARIVRLEAYHPELYKTSKLREEEWQSLS